MALSKPILSGNQDVSPKVLEDAYLDWLQYFEAKHPRFNPVSYLRPKGLWRNLHQGVVSSVTLFPSTRYHCDWPWERSAPSVAEAIMHDWHAVGLDLYSALVKDRIKTHNCGQSSF